MRHSEPPSSVVARIQGIRVRFSSDLEPLNAFARTHFAEPEQERRAELAAPRPNGPDEQTEIDADVRWIEDVPPRSGVIRMSPGKTLVDRDIEIGDGELAWSRIDDYLSLRLRFSLQAERLRLQGQHYFALAPTPRGNRIRRAWYWQRLPTLRAKRFSTILYYTMYYPAFWWLERRGLFPLHAAAVDVAGSGVVLCGLPGCGKSTLSLALLSLPETRLLSDNMIFFDRERVWRCPEPVLVDDRSLKLIGAVGSLLHGVGRRHVYGRAWCHLPPDRLVNDTKPRLWLFVRLGEKSSLRPLPLQEALQRVAAANWIAQEVRRYLVYRSVLGHLSPDSLLQGHGDETIVRQLCDQGRCYELTVGLDDGLPKALDHVHTLVAAVRS